MSDLKTTISKMNPASRRQARILIWLVLLIGVGVGSRFLLTQWPNFKPVTALAIFCGFFCASRWPVAMVLAATLLVSDAILGFYELPVMVSVYASLFLSIWLGSILRRVANQQAVVAQTVGLGLTALLASLLFFFLTNTAVWIAGWYPPSFDGLLQSYVAGLPFLRFTVAGDLGFSLLLFASWHVLRTTAWTAESASRCACQEISSTGWPRISRSG